MGCDELGRREEGVGGSSSLQARKKGREGELVGGRRRGYVVGWVFVWPCCCSVCWRGRQRRRASVLREPAGIERVK